MTRRYSFLLLTTLVLVGNSPLLAQIDEVPMMANPALPKSASKSTARQLSAERIDLFVPLNNSIEFCLSDLTGDLTESAEFNFCTDINFGEATISNICITYVQLGTIGTDVVCAEICDSNGTCIEYEIAFIAGSTIGLPFVEDFAYPGPYPDTNLWLDRHVFVNNTLAQHPPTIGIATFDGISSTGSPYGGGYNFSDNLTSTFIDLSNEGDTVYFSFFAQVKGVGVKPKTNDSLVVDFKTSEGNWVRMWQKEGLPNSFPTYRDAPPFEFERWIVPDSFKHSSFQFRFRNKSSNQGLQELWHLDYVRVGVEQITREKFTDVALQFPPPSLLSPYTHMPARHFAPDDVRTNIISLFNNLDKGSSNITVPKGEVRYNGEILSSRTLVEPVELTDLPAGESSFDIFLGEENLNPLRNSLTDILSDEEYHVAENRYSFVKNNEDFGADANNVASTRVHFSNYFAYDDGSTETALIDNGSPGTGKTRFAMEFNTTVDDELQGVQFLFPRVIQNNGDDPDQENFNLYIYLNDLNDEPDFTQFDVTTEFADNYLDTLQGFTTYALRNEQGEKISLPIPAGKFFIAWEQGPSSGGKIPIGYDINSPDGYDFCHYSVVNVGWVPFINSGLRKGTMMVRALMGNEAFTPTSTDDIDIWPELTLWPNPASTTLRLSILNGHSGTVEIVNSQGKIVLRSPLQNTININSLRSGSYFIQINNNTLNQTTIRKLIIIK